MILRTGTALLLVAALTAPALADSYPVSGRWGQSDSGKKGPIDCTGKRVITFKGEQRFDTGGGVPGYHNKSVRTDGADRWRIVDQFSNGHNQRRHHQPHADQDRRRSHRARPGGRPHAQTAAV